MKKITQTFIVFFLLGSSTQAQEFDIEHLYPIEASHSYLQFEVTYMGYAKVKGSFGNFYGSIYYNPDAPSQTSVTFQVDVESIDTNNDWRDKDLKSKNWFLAEEYPHIHFSSTEVIKEGEGFEVKGDLSIKETTQEISFKIPPPIGVIRDMREDDQVIFIGEHTLNRKEYGVMGKNWSQVKEGIAALSDEVTIEFSLLGKQINASNFSNFLRNKNSPHGSVYAAYKEGGIKKALDHYYALKGESKSNAQTLNMVAYLLMAQGKLAEAKTLMEQNQQDYPEEANVYDSLGELHGKLGEIDKARSFYQKSLELNPDNINAQEVLKHLE